MAVDFCEKKPSGGVEWGVRVRIRLPAVVDGAGVGRWWWWWLIGRHPSRVLQYERIPPMRLVSTDGQQGDVETEACFGSLRSNWMNLSQPMRVGWFWRIDAHQHKEHLVLYLSIYLCTANGWPMAPEKDRSIDVAAITSAGVHLSIISCTCLHTKTKICTETNLSPSLFPILHTFLGRILNLAGRGHFRDNCSDNN